MRCVMVPMVVKRIRGRALQALRHRHLSAHPLCLVCMAQGRVTAATELDHIVALCNGGGNTDINYQALCHGCHQVKTAKDKGHTVRASTGLDGWPL